MNRPGYKHRRQMGNGPALGYLANGNSDADDCWDNFFKVQAQFVGQNTDYRRAKFKARSNGT